MFEITSLIKQTRAYKGIYRDKINFDDNYKQLNIEMIFYEKKNIMHTKSKMDDK